MSYAQHPLSAAWPSMAEADFTDLCADIKVNGQRVPIVIYDGMVLDGWHRYRACEAAGIEPMTEPFPMGGRLYVTTYPCHSCARHIVAAGIKVVYYIEPYKKSLATKLHGDSVTEQDQDMDRVRFLPYDGVAPSRYLALFRMKPDSRKKDGKVIRVSPNQARPKLEKSLEALPALEALVVKSLVSKKLVLGAGQITDGE